MKKLLPIIPLTLLATTALHAETLLVSFNGSSFTGATTFSYPGTGLTTNLGTDELTFDFVNFEDSFSSGNAGEFANVSSEWGSAATSYFFVRDTTVDSPGKTGTLTITGFTPGSYKLELISSVASDNGFRDADILANGSLADFGGGTAPYGEDYNAHTEGFDTGIPLTWNNIATTGASSDTITLTVTTPGEDYVGFINGLQITQIPEPSSVALMMGAAVIPLFFLRRKRK